MGSNSSGGPGSDGSNATGTWPGTGQGTTTKEFGEDTGQLYSTGGSKAVGVGTSLGKNGSRNTGDGGGGGGNSSGGYGGSGIVIIRNHRA